MIPARFGPDKDYRAKNIVDDPYAAAKFFHFTILSVKVTPSQVKSDVGVFGCVTAYFGMVESQGHGTLHFHLLVWLKHVSSSDETSAPPPQTEGPQPCVTAFIRANIRP